MIEEEDPQERKAIRKWNLAMYLKRKARSSACRSFTQWKLLTADRLSSQAEETESQINVWRKQISQIRDDKESNQTAGQIAYSNQQLQRELDELVKEQKDLELATKQVKNTLSTMQTSSIQGSYRSTSRSSRALY